MLTPCGSGPYLARHRTRTLNKHLVTASVARQSMQSEAMDCFTSFAMTGVFMESRPYPARYRTRTLNKDLVTASVARQSMQLEVMDCFTCVSQ